MLKFISKISIVVLILLQVFTLAGCGEESEVQMETYIPKVKTIAVAAGISSEVQTTGEVQAQKSVALSAEVKANVAKVFVKNGESVAAGQVLVVLNSDSVQTSFTTAQSAYSNANSGLTQTGLSVEKNIEAARIALSTAEINLANTLNQAATTRKQAEEALNSARLNSSLSTAAAQTALENAIRNTFPIAQNAVAKCDEIIGVSEIYRYTNDSFENLLGAFKSTTMPTAERVIDVALEALAGEFTDYPSAKSLLARTEDAVAVTLDVLNNSAAGAVLPQAALSGYLAGMTAQLATVRGAISTLESAQRNLESAQQNNNGKSQTFVTAQANYETTLSQIGSTEIVARRAVEAAKAALASAERGAALNRVGAKTSVDAALGGLQQAQITADKLTIRAPFAGKISGVAVEMGDEVNPGMNLVTVEDPNNLKLVTYLSGSEVRKLRVGDTVYYGSKSSAQITTLAPSADSQTKKYKVEIFTVNRFLRSGEFVKISFRSSEAVKKDQRIFLPLVAINLSGNGNSVWRVVSSKALKTPVILGEIEGEFVEVLDGIKLGDEVIIEGGRILDLDKDKIAIQIEV